MKGFFKKGDLIAVFLILTLCLALIAGKTASSAGRYALVYENGRVVYKIDLESRERLEISIAGGKLLKEKGRIRYISSDCPDKICEKTGWLEKVGDTAACVPNRSAVTVIGAQNTDFDVITY